MPHGHIDNASATRCLCVLIVDDEAIHREFAGVALERAGHAVLYAENSRACLDVLDAHDVDLVLTDIFMPGSDGIELAREVKALFPDLRVIGMTAGLRNDVGPYKRALSLHGVTTVLRKPFTHSALLEVL